MKRAYGKINEEHFKEKKMEIDSVDFDDIKLPLRSSTPTPSESTILAGNLQCTLLDLGVTDEQKRLMDEYEMQKRENNQTPANSQDTQNAQCNDNTLESGDAEMVEMAQKDTALLDALDSQETASDGYDVLASFMPRRMKEAYVKKRALHEMKKIADANTLPSEVYCQEWINDNSGIAESNTDEAPSLYAENLDLSGMLDLTSVSQKYCAPTPNKKKGRHFHTCTRSVPETVDFV